MKNYYKILGVEPESELKQIKKAYWKMALKFHPDRNSDHDASKLFIEINEAYQVLSNPQKRKIFDEYFNLRKASTQITSEVEKFSQENIKNGYEKAKEYSKMNYETYRKHLLKEIGLRLYYLFHIAPLFLISICVIGLFVGIVESIIQSDSFFTIYLSILFLGTVFLTIRMYKKISVYLNYKR